MVRTFWLYFSLKRNLSPTFLSQRLHSLPFPILPTFPIHNSSHETFRSSTAVSKIALENNMISSFITLGTPHESPDTALVDQTRGLLREIAETPSCSSNTLVNEKGIDTTCVCSSSLAGNFFTTNIEEFVAASSYLPLLGKTDASVKGDGIVPLDLAFMEEPARRVVLPECPTTGRPIRHIHVLPTPWNLWDPSAKSISLNDADATSYVSPDIVAEWSQFIR
jgi:hypothetical protein